jgi:integrase
VNLDGKCLLVQQGKGQKSRTIYPCEECLKALRDWLGFRATIKLPHDSLFVTMTRQPMGRTTLANTIEDIKAIAGFRADPRIKRHSIRHAAATRLMRNGADIKSIQIWRPRDYGAQGTRGSGARSRRFYVAHETARNPAVSPSASAITMSPSSERGMQTAYALRGAGTTASSTSVKPRQPR